MSKRQIIILLSAIIILLALFSGLPTVWNKTLYVLLGLFIIIVAYTTTKPSEQPSKKTESVPYVDAHPTAPVVTEEISTPTPQA